MDFFVGCLNCCIGCVMLFGGWAMLNWATAQSRDNPHPIRLGTGVILLSWGVALIVPGDLPKGGLSLMFLIAIAMFGFKEGLVWLFSRSVKVGGADQRKHKSKRMSKLKRGNVLFPPDHVR